MSLGYVIQGVCDRCGVTRSFKTQDSYESSGWATYPGGLTLCPHCRILFENGYLEKMAQVEIKEEMED